MRRLISVCAVCQDKYYTLGNGRFQYNDEALINFVLIGDKSSKGPCNENIITNSVKIGFREITIASMHTFCTRKITVTVIEIFHSFGPNVYALAFLRICSYAPDLSELRLCP